MKKRNASPAESPPVDPILFELFKEGMQKGDYKRAEIIAAAIRIFAELGYENVSLDVLGKRLGTTRSHIVYYYPTKDALFEAVVQYIIAHAQAITVAAVQRAETVEDQLVAVLLGALAWAELHPDQAIVLIFFYYHACYHSESRALNTRIRKVGAERIAALLAKEEKALKSRRKPESRLREARGLQRIISGVILDALSTDARSDTGELKAEVKVEAEALFRRAVKDVLTKD